MKPLIAAALCLALPGCAHERPAAPPRSAAADLAEQGVGGIRPEQVAPMVAELCLELAFVRGQDDLPPSCAGLPTGIDAGPKIGIYPRGVPTAVREDPERDSAFPARNRQLVIPSGPVRPDLGRPAEMNALFLLAAGEGPKPTLLLLHGLPGNERNFDLAQAVRRGGWNVLIFTYRGAWGSEGMFSIQHSVADAEAALAFLATPEAARSYGVDASRLVVAGHSMGGYVAAAAAAKTPPIAGVILLDAWDIAATAREMRAAGPAGRAAFIAGLDDLGHAIDPITAADLADSLARRGGDWDLLALAPTLAGKPLLTVYATHGLAAANRALAGEIGRTCLMRPPGCRLTEVELDTDHAFADKRIALAAEVVRWLDKLAPPGR